MNTKVEQFANGIFEYENPQILLSVEEIILTLEAGKSSVGEFVIKNNKNTVVSGEVYSTNDSVKLSQNHFSGVENTIQYEFYGRYLELGDFVKSEIIIISDCKEVKIPFHVTIEMQGVASSMGKIKDLFNFANLAKLNWAEAVRLFKTNEFRLMIMNQEERVLLLYDSLIKSRSGSQALEEFLIAVKKKVNINYIIDKNVLHYEVGEESFMDKVTIMKDNWGYGEIRVSTDAPFLSLEHKIVWTDYFIGNTYPLEFVVSPSLMKSGNSFGRIYLTSIHETMVVEVVCHKKVIKVHGTDKTKSSKTGTNKTGTIKNETSKAGTNIIEPNKTGIKEKVALITKLYLNFRMNQIPMKAYVLEVSPILEGLIHRDSKNSIKYKLMQIHLKIISEKDSEILGDLDILKDEILNLKEDRELYESAYHYLSALALKDYTTIEVAMKYIKSHYSRSDYNWKLLWFLLYTDQKYDSNKILKLADIKEAYKNGCISPILYFEAMTVFHEEPVLLHELSEFELQVLHWAIVNDFCNEEVGRQFTYLVGKKKNYHPLYYKNLILLYQKYQTKEILSTICSMLIKGHKRSNKYFYWFQLGVKEQLRITELYEYYMYTLNEELGQELPQSVLLYFIYSSNLSDRKKGYLYSYIIKNKGIIPSIYQTYVKKIENFANKLIQEHIVNREIAFIYEEVFKQRDMTKDLAKDLPEVMFKHEIGCSNKNMKGVFVVCKELEGERYYPFVNQMAQIDLYTENYELIFVDHLDCRYAKTIVYTLDKLMDYEHFAKDLARFHQNPMLLINLAGKILTYQKFDEDSVKTRVQLLAIKSLKIAYRNEILLDLIQYYYDNFKADEMEIYIDQIDLALLSMQDRTKIIELYLIRDHFDLAVNAIKKWGYETIQMNKLLKLFTHVYHMEKEEEEDKGLTNLSYHIFSQGKYNEEILIYLSKYYKGATGDMYRIWEVGVAFEVDMTCLEERLLSQMLYAEDYIANSLAVFLEYYKKGSNRKLIRAFLSYHAYKYLVMGRIIKTDIFEIMKKELVYEENEISLMALLKKYSFEEYLNDVEREFIDIHVHEFMKKGIVLPFFKRFSDVIDMHPHISDRFFVEYITSTSHKVTLHYQMEDETETFNSEVMPNVFYGIHIKDFVLFYNETIRYYITEESKDGETVITESVNASLGQDMKLEEDSWYNQINFLLTGLEMKDEKTVLEGIKNYVTTKHLANELIKII